MVKNKIILITSTLLLLSVSTTAFAQLYVFPAKGQSEQQMEQDKFSCYGWAKNQTGFDPMNPPRVQSGSSSTGSSALGGAARGAAGGAIIGAIAGNAGKGAAIGAGVGGVGRGLMNKNQSNQNQQNMNQQASQISQMKNDYDRAYGVCLEGKGYTVR